MPWVTVNGSRQRQLQPSVPPEVCQQTTIRRPRDQPLPTAILLLYTRTVANPRKRAVSPGVISVTINDAAGERLV